MSTQQPPAGAPPEVEPPTQEFHAPTQPPTQEHQPHPGNGHAAPPMAPAAYQAPPPPMIPPTMHGPPMTAVPPMPPTQQGHGAGWWVGVIAAATAVGVLLVLGGFFLGRGTRLSDDSVQTKINQQRQADQISQQKALDAQATTMRHERSVAVRTASDRARARGIRQGRSEGHQQGVSEGEAQGFNNGQSSGYAQGQNDGFNNGLDTGSCLANSNFC
jgi:hypothetical protein